MGDYKMNKSIYYKDLKKERPNKIKYGFIGEMFVDYWLTKVWNQILTIRSSNLAYYWACAVHGNMTKGTVWTPPSNGSGYSSNICEDNDDKLCF